ncbi:MAG: hypothetical protein II864_10360 [Prevotella sp.]|nr:hypothetical protein [Prevotella sp.]
MPGPSTGRERNSPIGRPSSRAGIIETLFKRHYIRRERKRLVATPTGIELIDLIREELLKSCELTGIWEKKLRDIEHRKYDAQQFIEELKAQVTEIVNEVMSDPSNRRVTVVTEAELKKKPAPRKTADGRKPAAKKAAAKTPSAATPPAATPPQPLIAEGQPCPLCGEGRIVRGRTAFGCSRWREGCTWRHPLE